jgi:hypothetical protein
VTLVLVGSHLYYTIPVHLDVSLLHTVVQLGGDRKRKRKSRGIRSSSRAGGAAETVVSLARLVLIYCLSTWYWIIYNNNHNNYEHEGVHVFVASVAESGSTCGRMWGETARVHVREEIGRARLR